MGEGDSIVALLSELPCDGLTVKLLETLDFLVPGQWHNTTDIATMIQRARSVSRTQVHSHLESI